MRQRVNNTQQTICLLSPAPYAQCVHSAWISEGRRGRNIVPVIRTLIGQVMCVLRRTKTEGFRRVGWVDYIRYLCLYVNVLPINCLHHKCGNRAMYVTYTCVCTYILYITRITGVFIYNKHIVLVSWCNLNNLMSCLLLANCTTFASYRYQIYYDDFG